MLRETRDGLRVVLGSPTLRAIAAAHGSTHLLWGIFGTVYLLFATRDLALGPAAIGIIAGVGGAGSFFGAAVAGRVIARFGIGQTMLLGMVGFTVGNALIPLAPSGAVLVGAGFLVVQQLVGDSAGTVYDVVETSLTQSIVAPRILGRVNASIRTYDPAQPGQRDHRGSGRALDCGRRWRSAFLAASRPSPSSGPADPDDAPSHRLIAAARTTHPVE